MNDKHPHSGENLGRTDSDQDPLSPKAQAFLLSAMLEGDMKPLPKRTRPRTQHSPASLTAFAEQRGRWAGRKALNRPCPGQAGTAWGLSLSEQTQARSKRPESPRRSGSSLRVSGDQGRSPSCSSRDGGVLLGRPPSVPRWRKCRSRERTQGPARFPPTQTSVQDKARQGCATGQQHNKSPPASSPPIVLLQELF